MNTPRAGGIHDASQSSFRTEPVGNDVAAETGGTQTSNGTHKPNGHYRSDEPEGFIGKTVAWANASVTPWKVVKGAAAAGVAYGAFRGIKALGRKLFGKKAETPVSQMQQPDGTQPPMQAPTGL